MRLFSAAICATLLCAAVPASAQTQILVAHPPVYQPGENFIGLIRLEKLGITAEYVQYTRLEGDGIVHVLGDAVIDGIVVTRMDLRSDTWTGVIKSSKATVRILSSTCMKVFYPVYIGKRATCAMVTQKNNDPPVTTAHWFDFTHTERNANGQITAICQTELDSQGDTDTCSTPDMKWVVAMVLKNVSGI